MENSKEKIKGFLAPDNMQRIFESKEFVWVWAAVVLICWVTNGWMAGFIIAALVACMILCTCRDSLPTLAILWTFLFMLGVNRHSLGGNGGVIAAVIPIVVGFLVNIIRFKPSFKFLSYKTVSVTTVGILVFCAAVAVSGIAVKGRNLPVAFIIVALSLLLALGYLFFTATISGGEDGKRAVNYVLFLMLVSGVIITAELFIRYIQIGGIMESFNRKSMDIGWGGPNNYSIVLAMMIPATLYYAVKSGKYNPLLVLLAVAQFGLVVLSRSRGSILFGGLVFIVMLGYAVVKSEYRGRMVTTLIIIVDIALLLTMYYGKEVSAMLGKVLALGLDDNGRKELYETALNLFKSQPIFGVGFDYNLGGLASDDYTPFWYHSTFFQALASTGTVGFIGWIYLECTRLRAFVTGRSPEKFYLLCGFAIFWLYALIDVFYFTPNGLIFLFIMTLAAEKTLTEKNGRPVMLKYIEQKHLKRLLCKEVDNESK